MAIIENFAALSEQEQRAFAEALIKTINSENLFTSETDFTVEAIEADDMSGCLFIVASTTGTVTVDREATWTCLDEDEAHSPEDPEYTNYASEDAEEAFKTDDVILDGYRVIFNDIDEVDTQETVYVDVDSIKDEDDGIGWYEYWGHMEYDSHPYCKVEGTITEACKCTIIFEVVAADEPTNTEPEED